MSVKSSQRAVETFANNKNAHEILGVFRSEGKRLLETLQNVPKPVRYRVSRWALAYSLITYNTEQKAVRQYINGARSPTEAIDAQRNGPKGEWWNNLIDNDIDEIYIDTLLNDGISAARGVLLEYDGFTPNKVDMPALLLGHPDAFVMDRWVRRGGATLLKNMANLGYFPTCESCWNSHMRGHIDGFKNGDNFMDRRIFTKMPYFVDKHLKKHVTRGQMFNKYAPAIVNHVRDRTGKKDLSAREVTQILFGLGQPDDTFYIHAEFYRKIGV